MKVVELVEKNFWIFMISGIVMGLIYPTGGKELIPFLELLLMIMLFLVFLKIDLIEVLHNIKNFKLMLYLVLISLVIIPAIVYFIAQFIDENLAIGLLLLTAMPAGTASPALTDLLKGNSAMAMSLAILTSLIAPFTVPALFTVLNFQNVEIDALGMFKTLALLVFVPMICSQVMKIWGRKLIKRSQFSFSAVNVILIFFIVYAAIGFQADVILKNFNQLLIQLFWLYVFFIGLHIVGYFMAFKMKKEVKIAVAISNAYMNNSIAIILATAFFHPSVLILAILSELPWNTLLPSFQFFLRYDRG